MVIKTYIFHFYRFLGVLRFLRKLSYLRLQELMGQVLNRLPIQKKQSIPRHLVQRQRIQRLPHRIHHRQIRQLQPT